MVVESSNNIPNKNMHYSQSKLVGVIDTVPDTIKKKTYYSKVSASQMFAEADRDVFQRLKAAPEPKKGGVPTVLKVLFGVFGVGSLVLWGKSIGKGLLKFIKNLPK